MRIIILAVAIFILSGCASRQLEGIGEVTQLSINQVIYRDLTQPVSLHNPQKVHRIVKDQTPIVEADDNLETARQATQR